MKNKKKFWHYLVIFGLVLVTITPLIISLEIYHTTLAPIDPVTNTNTMIDLSQNHYQLHWKLKQKIGYKATYYYEMHAKKRDFAKLPAIKRLTDAFFSEIIDNDPIDVKIKPIFKNYNELMSALKNVPIKASIENLVTAYGENDHKSNHGKSYTNEIKQLFLNFYNFVANTWGKLAITNIIYKIELVDLFDKDDTHGQAHLISKKIELKRNGMKRDYFKHSYLQWKIGWWSSDQLLGNLVHELGHLVHSYNAYKENLIINELKKFVVRKINNIMLFPELDPETIKLTFAPSRYGLTSDYEWFAEIFSYWFLTPKQLRTKAWQLTNQFLTTYKEQ